MRLGQKVSYSLPSVCSATLEGRGASGRMVCTIGVDGMTCHSCVSLIESAVGEMAGVAHVRVSLENKEGRVEYDGTVVTPEEIRATIDDTGFLTTFVRGKTQLSHCTQCLLVYN